MHKINKRDSFLAITGQKGAKLFSLRQHYLFIYYNLCIVENIKEFYLNLLLKINGIDGINYCNIKT